MKKDERTTNQITHELAILQQEIEELRKSKVKYEQTIETLHKKGEYFKAITQNSSDIIIIVDKLGTITYVNPSVERFLGYKTEELIGKSAFSFIMPADLPRAVYDFGRAVLTKDVIIPNAFRVKDKDGSEHILEGVGNNLLDDPTVAGFVMNVRDITKRRQAEDDLRLSEEKFRTLVENTNDVLFYLDTEGHFTYISPAIKRFARYEVDDILGQHFSRFIHPDDLPDLLASFRRTSSGELEAYDFRILAKDGLTLHVRTSSRPVFENSQPRGLTGIMTDITKLKQAEEALKRAHSELEQLVEERTAELAQANELLINDIEERKRAEELYRTLANSSQMGVYITNGGKLQFVNPLLAEYTGYSESSLIGMNISDFVHPGDQSEAKSHAINMLEGRRSTPYEYRMVDCDGRIKCVMETVRSITYEGRRAVLGNIVDVTELHNMERMLRQARKMEAIGTLAGGIAHDFNNILTAIIGYAEMVLRKEKGRPVQHSLEQILKAGYRARDLVKQILTFSRQTEHERKPVQVAPIIEEALKLLRSLLPSSVEIRQDIRVAPEKGIILADPTQIQQVLMNLCTNAAHAMRDKGGVLDVSLSEVDIDDSLALRHPDLTIGPYVCLVICDTGHGMDTSVLERIFDPYFTTKGTGEGTGLGLAVVQGIVKSYNGAITVYSEPGIGTTFNVYLPRIEEGLPLVAETVELVATGGNERILFIDDEKVLTDMGKEMLVSLGYVVTTRTSSIEALEAFRDHPEEFDLVITDMTMPGMTGMDLAKEFMMIRPNIPIILCTGFSELINEKRAKEAGIRKFILKPYVITGLAKAIRQVLEQK